MKPYMVLALIIVCMPLQAVDKFESVLKGIESQNLSLVESALNEEGALSRENWSRLMGRAAEVYNKLANDLAVKKVWVCKKDGIKILVGVLGSILCLSVANNGLLDPERATFSF